MHNRTLTVTELVRHFSDYISRVAYRHESFVLSKGKKPVAELRPVTHATRLGDLPSILRALPLLSRQDATAFAQDIDSAREALVPRGMGDPWES